MLNLEPQRSYTRAYRKLDATQQESVTADIRQKLRTWDGKSNNGLADPKGGGIWQLDILSGKYRLLLCVHGNDVWLLDIISKQNKRLQCDRIEKYKHDHRKNH